MKAYREWDKITKNGSWEVSGFETFRATEAGRVTKKCRDNRIQRRSKSQEGNGEHWLTN